MLLSPLNLLNPPDSRLKKQYDGYIQYWSKRLQYIKIYCGTIMVDHCHSKKFGKHFLKFMDKVKLQLQLILQLSIDGPNVNLRSEECLNASLEMKKSYLISLKNIPQLDELPLERFCSNFETI